MNDTTHIHDFNPGFGPAVSSVDSGNGFGTRVFWTAAIPDSDFEVNVGAGTAKLSVHNLPELDYAANGFAGNVSLGPLWQSASVPATVSFDVVWDGPVTRRVHVKDAANGFAGVFNENQATVTWSAHSDSGFSFTSNPGNFSTSVPEIPGVNGITAPLNFFAEVGQERNGSFFPLGSEEGDGQHGGSALAHTPMAGIASLPALTTAAAPALGGPMAGHPVGTALDAVSLVHALSAYGPGPATTGPTSLPPQRADALAATPFGKDQAIQPTSAPDRLAAGTAHPRVLDQVFADLDGNALSDALRGDEVPAWAV